MMSLSKKIFQKKKILIYGLGKTGISSYNYLKNNNKIILYDDNKKVFRNSKLQNLYLREKKIKQINFDYIVISPGIDVNNCNLKNYLKINSRKIITDLDIFYTDHSKNKIVAITGTNGKSTTAKLLY